MQLIDYEYDAESKPVRVICEDDGETYEFEVVKHGYWIEIPANFPIHGKYFTCSVCEHYDNKNTAIRGCHCWYCGSKMDLEADKYEE